MQRTFALVHRAQPSDRLHLSRMEDPRQLLEEGRYEELAHDDHPLWRGLALLELRRFSQGAHSLEEAPDAAQSA